MCFSYLLQSDTTLTSSYAYNFGWVSQKYAFGANINIQSDDKYYVLLTLNDGSQYALGINTDQSVAFSFLYNNLQGSYNPTSIWYSANGDILFPSTRTSYPWVGRVKQFSKSDGSANFVDSLSKSSSNDTSAPTLASTTLTISYPSNSGLTTGAKTSAADTSSQLISLYAGSNSVSQVFLWQSSGTGTYTIDALCSNDQDEVVVSSTGLPDYMSKTTSTNPYEITFSIDYSSVFGSSTTQEV